MTGKAVLSPVGKMFDRSAQDLAATVTPGWAPGAAHFTGKTSDDKVAGESKAGEATLESLKKEIEEKRKE